MCLGRDVLEKNLGVGATFFSAFVGMDMGMSIDTQFLGYWELSMGWVSGQFEYLGLGMGWVDIAKPIPKTQLFWVIKLCL